MVLRCEPCCHATGCILKQERRKLPADVTLRKCVGASDGPWALPPPADHMFSGPAAASPDLSFWTDVYFESDHMGLEDSDELTITSQN